jgi:hypothetical protein
MMAKVKLRHGAVAGKIVLKSAAKTFHVAHLSVKSVAIFTAHCH